MENNQKEINSIDSIHNEDTNREKQKFDNLDSTSDGNNDIENEEISMEELLKEEGEKISSKLYNREPVYVQVVAVNNDYIYVDIGEKNEGIIPVKDFEGFKLPRIGTKIIAVLEKKGNEEKNTVLSYRKAKETITLKWLEKAFKERQRIKGKVVEQVKGGYIVSINGVNAFMPLSLSELGKVHKHYLPVNAKIKFYLTNFDPKNRKIIVSRKEVLEEDERERREKILNEIKEGDIVRAVVAKIIDNGIFVRFQGIEGFVKLEDIDWKNPKEALTQYRRGQRIKAKILNIDKEKQKLTFGIKQTKPNPIDIIKRKFPLKTKLSGKVVEINDGYAKIHIVDDIYGVVYEEDYSYDGSPEKNSIVESVVVGYLPETFELKLSIKKYEQIENRKRIEQYTKQTPKITLGQLLKETTNKNAEGE